MFAVPGWAVSASSLVQEKNKSKRSTTKHDLANDDRQPKRRKHDNRTTSTEPTDDPKESDNGRGGKESKKLKQSATEPENKKQDTHESLQERARRKHQDLEAVSHKQRNPSFTVDDSTFTKTGNAQGARGKPSKGDRQHSRNGMSPHVAQLHPPETVSKTLASLLPVPSTKLTPLQAKMRSKLTSARFRHLNETLYTTTSDDAMSLFSASPELFSEYHAGFAQQVKESWPQNPVDEYIKTIKARGAVSEARQGIGPLPRRKTGSCTIADLGCGDAPLARGCQSVIRKLTLKFHNYDLHAPNTFVTKADISDLPLRDGEADVAVFCLSLMGTNWISFVEEAWRILRGDGKGEVWVAEVKSRFGRVTRGRVVENSVGKRRKAQKPGNSEGDKDHEGAEQFVEDTRPVEGQDDETDPSAFIKVFTRRGFQLREGSVNKRNKMFVSMTFTKSGIPTAGKHKGLKWNGKEYQNQQEGKSRFASGHKDIEDITPEEEAKALKPCVYKTR